MLFKYLIFAVLFYFIIKASKNLVRAVRGELDAPASRSHVDTSRPSGWNASSQQRKTSTRTQRSDLWEEDIEDATWEDL